MVVPMTGELITMNIRTPHIKDTKVLEVVGAGIMFLFDHHKLLDAELDEFMMMDHAKLTMGDHLAELVDGNEDFESLYNSSVNGLEFVLTTQTEEIKQFASQLKEVSDIITLQYPGLIKMYVTENKKGIWK